MGKEAVEIFNFQFLFYTVLSECLAILPFRLLALYLFRRQIHIPVWAAVATTCLLQAAQAVLHAYTIASNYQVKIVDYGFEFFFFVLLFLFIRSDRWKVLFQYIFVLDYSIATQGISRVFDSAWFHGPKRHTDTMITAVATFIIFTASAPFITKYLKKSGESTAGINAPFFWRTIWMLPAINTLIVMMYTNNNTRENNMRPQFLASRILLFLSMFLVYVILMRILDVIRREAALEEQTAKQDEILAAERMRHDQQERYLTEMRQVRHDNIQHLRVMKSLIEHEDYDALKDYMKQYEESIPKSAPKTWCINHTANVLISYYAGEFSPHGIDFSVEAYLPEKLPVSDPDFCSILGNLLENALAACLKAPELSPFVKLRARTGKNQIILTVDNTCAEPPEMEGEAFRSTKHEGMGIGTLSVRSTTKKYHGNAQFRYQDHVFYASVLLFSPETEAEK